MKNPKHTDAIKHPNKLKAVVESVKCSQDLRQFLVDLGYFLQERADGFKVDMETRDTNEELIELLEYCGKQAEAQATAVWWRLLSQR
ncbi:hypothetical protein [Myxosarcina sp. GI1]|uniref:hypothetical protein n=1 Tax=Myxosarcina sp. GI1 TaxID=1541065 RepID=UPI0005646762|nr:hypothetical protein [Myxosarcina sp. GI1]